MPSDTGRASRTHISINDCNKGPNSSWANAAAREILSTGFKEASIQLLPNTKIRATTGPSPTSGSSLKDGKLAYHRDACIPIFITALLAIPSTMSMGVCQQMTGERKSVIQTMAFSKEAWSWLRGCVHVHVAAHRPRGRSWIVLDLDQPVLWLIRQRLLPCGSGVRAYQANTLQSCMSSWTQWRLGELTVDVLTDFIRNHSTVHCEIVPFKESLSRGTFAR